MLVTLSKGSLSCVSDVVTVNLEVKKPVCVEETQFWVDATYLNSDQNAG